MKPEKPGLAFRPARPSDVETAVPLIYSAGPRALDYMFGAAGVTSDGFLRYAFAEGGGFFGHRVHTVVEASGQVIGIGAFYGDVEFTRLSLEMVRQVFRFYGAINSWSVLRRTMHCKRVMPRPGPRTEFIANLGVVPEMRSHGVGQALLRHQLEVARRKRQSAYALDVAVNNQRAQALYERLGFRVVFENRFGRDGAVPDCRRMEMSLGDASLP